MVWKRGRWLAPNPEKYESLPGWKINPSHLLQKPDIQKDPQASENKAESPIAVTTSVEKLNIAKGSLIVGQPTPDAALFNKPSNHCQFEPEVSSMNLLFNHDMTSAGEDDAIVTSDDGSPPKRNPKMRLLKSVVLKDFMMRMEQEIGKELQMGKEQKERSTIEALESARKVESLGKEPSSGKRLHSRVFDGTDESTLFSAEVVTSSCFSGDVQPSQELAGTITPMLGDRKKIRPSSLSSIHNFRIRNVVEMSSAGPRGRENLAGLMASTVPNENSMRRQGFSAAIGCGKRKRLVPRRIRSSQEVTGQGSRSRCWLAKVSKESNPSSSPTTCCNNLSSASRNANKQKFILQDGYCSQDTHFSENAEGTIQRVCPRKISNLSIVPTNCSIKDFLSGHSVINVRRKRNRFISQLVPSVGVRKRGRPRKTCMSGLLAKYSMKGAKSDEREKLTYTVKRKGSSSHILDQSVRELSGGFHLEQKNNVSVESNATKEPNLGYIVRASQTERTKVSARQAHCSLIKVLHQDPHLTRSSVLSRKRLLRNVFPGDINSEDCESVHCKSIDPGVACNVTPENCHCVKEQKQSASPPAVLNRKRDGRQLSYPGAISEVDCLAASSLQDADGTASVKQVMETHIHASLQDANGTGSAVKVPEIGETRQTGNENDMLRLDSLCTEAAYEPVNSTGKVLPFEFGNLPTVCARVPFLAEEDQTACQTTSRASEGHSVLLAESQSGAMGLVGDDCTNPELEAAVLPFLKTSPLWESLQLLDVFCMRAQQPHFHPLRLCRTEYREGHAIGLMVSFANLIDSMCKLSITDDSSTLEEKLKCLVDFEEYGFNIDHARTCLEELLRIKGEDCSHRTQEAELKGQVADKEDEICRLDLELDSFNKKLAELERTMVTLREKHASAMHFRNSRESEVARLKEKILAAKEGYVSCELHFNSRVGSFRGKV